VTVSQQSRASSYHGHALTVQRWRSALTDLAGGRLTYTFDGAAVQLPYVQAERSGPSDDWQERFAALPDVPP
jgi:hypothetical protein